MNHQKIDYKVISTKNESWFDVRINTEALEAKLNELGIQGWDLVNTFDINHHSGNTKEVILILKRYDR